MKFFLTLLFSSLLFLALTPLTHAQSVPVCLAEITYAKSPYTHICKSFSSSCEVPKNWTVVDQCPTVSAASNYVTTTTLYSLWKYGNASIKVVDQNGKPVSGAEISGSWSGFSNGLSFGVTNTSGIAHIPSMITSSSQTLKYCITSIYLSGYSYTPSSSTCSN